MALLDILREAVIDEQGKKIERLQTEIRGFADRLHAIVGLDETGTADRLYLDMLAILPEEMHPKVQAPTLYDEAEAFR